MADPIGVRLPPPEPIHLGGLPLVLLTQQHRAAGGQNDSGKFCHCQIAARNARVFPPQYNLNLRQQFPTSPFQGPRAPMLTPVQNKIVLLEAEHKRKHLVPRKILNSDKVEHMS
jgi:hypothetical protein